MTTAHALKRRALGGRSKASRRRGRLRLRRAAGPCRCAAPRSAQARGAMRPGRARAVRPSARRVTAQSPHQVVVHATEHGLSHATVSHARGVGPGHGRSVWPWGYASAGRAARAAARAARRPAWRTVRVDRTWREQDRTPRAAGSAARVATGLFRVFAFPSTTVATHAYQGAAAPVRARRHTAFR